MIGITGGIGSGKSTIAHELAKRGFAVYDCDLEAKRIIAENSDVQKAIEDLLGEEVFVNGKYNTAHVAKRVFEDETLLANLNSIVHPVVAEDIVQKQPDFVESAILYDAGLDKLCDKVIVIDAPEDIRIARTIARDYHGEATPENIAEIKARMSAQHIPSGKWTILNDGIQSIEVLVDKIQKEL